jgi:octaprenyl-diphosphate synthase
MAVQSPVLTFPRPDLFTDVTRHLSGIREALHEILERSSDLWFQDVLDYMLARQGKMLRGLLAAYSALGEDERLPANAYRIAALAELLHIASLLHDDVLDEATTRRASPSVNFKWGDKVAILVGDYILTRIFSCLTEVGRWEVLQEFIVAARALSEGSLIEVRHRYNLDLSEDEYFAIITRKTSALFSCALVAARALSDGSPEILRSLRTYGYHLGIAFQVTDDLLDYCGDLAVTGKSPLNDLRQGYITLPFIRAFSQPGRRTELEARRRGAGSDWKAFIVENEGWLISHIRAPETTASVSAEAESHRDRALHALAGLPEGVLRDRLAAVAEWVVSRDR